MVLSVRASSGNPVFCKETRAQHPLEGLAGPVKKNGSCVSSAADLLRHLLRLHPLQLKGDDEPVVPA